MQKLLKHTKKLLVVINFISLSVFLTFAAKSFAKVQTAEVKTEISTEKLPTQLVISELSIDLPIYPTEIIEGDWEEIDNGLLYLKESPLPGEIGNSVIYGHNTPNLLGNMYSIKTGSQIQVEYSDKTTQTFVVISAFNVTPEQTHILNGSTNSKLTIFTCNGFFDEKRFVVI
ncbi:sortase, partial [Candidatus Saccharibacteria bacterium]|nr:sortase [Candidatus Saccharibacteria bacterium]